MSNKPENTLVRAPNWIGDAVMSTSFIRALQEHDPGTRISVLAHRRVVSLFEYNPAIGRIIRFAQGESPWAIAARVRRERFDRCYVLPLSFSSALIARLAGIPDRIGYSSECRGMLFTSTLPFDQTRFRSRHLIDDYISLLGAPGPIHSPEVFLTKDEVTWAQLWLERRRLQGKTVIGFGPGATYGPAKRWPVERWIELGRRLKDQGRAVLIFGSLDESQLCKEIERNIGTTAVSLAGGTDLRQSAALIALCTAFVTNDTGVMHLAAAVGTTVIALFGSTNPAWTRPWGERHRVLYAKEPCSPCYARTCRYGHYNCLLQLSVDAVSRELDA